MVLPMAILVKRFAMPLLSFAKLRLLFPTLACLQLRKLFDKFLEEMLEFKRKNCKELMPIVELNGVVSLCRLLDCLCTKEFGVDPSDMDAFITCTKLWFLFS